MQHGRTLSRTKVIAASKVASSTSVRSPGILCLAKGFRLSIVRSDFPIYRPITKAYVQMAPKGSTMNQRTKGPNASINLNRPGINMKNVILGEICQVIE